MLPLHTCSGGLSRLKVLCETVNSIEVSIRHSREERVQLSKLETSLRLQIDCMLIGCEFDVTNAVA